MKIKRGRLLLILMIGGVLFACASTGALAALSLGSTPSEATANSVWNIAATWSDSSGVWPTLESGTRTEGLVDYGLIAGVAGRTIGTIRPQIPDVWADGMVTYPYMPPPDGFVGFPDPPGGADASALPGEAYQAMGYVSVQPNANATVSETGGDPAYDHGVDYIEGEQFDPSVGENDVPAPLGDGTLHATVVPYQAAADPRPELPTVIVPSRVPVLLVGVWGEPGHKAIKARIRNAAEIFPGDVASHVNGWPKYNVIEITEANKKIPAAYTGVTVSYYAPGTHYVITQQSPLPMPYTVYRVQIADSGMPYLLINDGLLRLDSTWAGDRSVLNTTQNPAACPIKGVYMSPDLDQAVAPDDATNYFDVTTAPPTAPAVRYEGPNSDHPTQAKLFFTSTPPKLDRGTTFYIKVATNAVDGVFLGDHAQGTNYYLRSDPDANPAALGYCSKSGIIRLGQTLPAPQKDAKIGAIVAGAQCTIKYRSLNSNSYTVGQTGSVGLLDSIDASAPTGFSAGSKDAGTGGGTIVVDRVAVPYGTYAARLNYWANCPLGEVVWFNGSTPMKWDGEHGPTQGAKFRVSVSAGLNMSNPKQQPYNDFSLNKPDTLYTTDDKGKITAITRWGNNKLIYDDLGWPMYYAPSLRPISAGATTSRIITAVGYGVKDRALVSYAKTVDDGVSVTVHDSRAKADGIIDYGGMGSERDWLTIVSNANQPSGTDVDPLSIEPVEEANPSTPDDGSSSNQFVFRVRYHNLDGLQPLPWLHSYADRWNDYNRDSNSGVVLYLDEQGTGDYRPHFMRREFPDVASDPAGAGDVYVFRIMPRNQDCYIPGWSDSWGFPFADDLSGIRHRYESNSLYESLACGTYHYFFACSDDSMVFADSEKSHPFEHQSQSKMNPLDPAGKTGLEEWGELLDRDEWSSTGLDPSARRSVTDYPEVARSERRRFTSDDVNQIDRTLYVDRVTRAPGWKESGWEYPYPYPCTQHPVVTCELLMPSQGDSFGTLYDDASYGWGRFYGTLSTYKWAVNPRMMGAYGLGSAANRAETSGAYSYETNVFRILYRQKDNKAPISIKLWLNDASEKSPNDAAHAYRSYTMTPKSGQTTKDYRTGVWYEVSLQSNTSQLPFGPHTYYFTADDGTHVAKWPARPDLYNYKSRSMTDWWVPTESQLSERRNADYFDNDYVPGPFVNHAPKITNVTYPSSAKEGVPFIFKATYSDEDGQRPNSTTITIRDASGAERTYAMVPDPSKNYNIDPTVDNSALYKAGVDYVLNTGTLGDKVLARGSTQFRIQFTDDWGRQTNVNDLRKGETATFGWSAGPKIEANSPPTLSNGSVDSADGTANPATLWSFKVNCTDLDDPDPAVMVFIGRLQPQDPLNPTSTAKTVLWDAGHTMTRSSSDAVNDGAIYSYETHLNGPSSVLHATVVPSDTTTVVPSNATLADMGTVIGVYVEGDTTNRNYYSGTTHPFAIGDIVIKLGTALPSTNGPRVYVAYQPKDGIQYYYAFVAYDSSSYATYASSSDAKKRSNAAGCFILQDAERVDATHFRVVPKIVRQIDVTAGCTAFDPDVKRIGDIQRVWGVFANEDLTGTNYLTVPAAGYVDYISGQQLNLKSAFPGTKAWVQFEGDTPIVGPLPIVQTSASSVITDARVYRNYTTSSDPLPVQDQKNGWISDDGLVRASVVQYGAALLEGQASATYVTPEDPASIASVEGVYWLDNPDETHRLDNYYEPDHAFVQGNSYDPPTLHVPVVRVGTVEEYTDANGDTKKYATVPDIDEVDGVLGVYDDPDLTTNYYRGAGYSTVAKDEVYKWQKACPLKNMLNAVLPTDPMDIVSIKGVYSSMSTAGTNLLVPADGVSTSYRPLWSEYVMLDSDAPADANGNPYPVYIAYYTVGKMGPGLIELTKDAPPAGSTVYVNIWPKGFNPGDKSIRLTSPLPDVLVDASFSSLSPGKVSPADSTKLGDIAVVTGVYVTGDAKNYYLGTANPFDPGDSYIYLGSPLPAGATDVKIAYIPKVRKVTIKYSDMRFTHLVPGTATQMSRATYDAVANSVSVDQTPGNNIYTIDGSASITGNTVDPLTGEDRDIDGAVVGVWAKPDQTGPNFFNPRRSTPISDWDNRSGTLPPLVQLLSGQETGAGTLYARLYQAGDYRIDRAHRELRFVDDKPVGDLDRIQCSYFFGTKMSQTIMPNTPPSLSLGSVTPITGSRNAQYTYSVTYTDPDGPGGQIPAYVRVFIDNVAYEMKPATDGKPAYKSGALFTFTPSGDLVGGDHKYHFEASDGAAIAWFDRNGGHQTEGGQAAVSVADMDGPWINDPPLLTNGLVKPNPETGGIGTRDSVEYMVSLKDIDNDTPYIYDPARDANNVPAHDQACAIASGSPRAWIDAGVSDDTTAPVVGKIMSIASDPLEPGKKRVITVKVADGSGQLVSPNWTADAYVGKLLQITNGDTWTDIYPSPYLRVYLIQSNTADTLVLSTDSLENDRLIVPADPATGAARYAEFRINGLLMSKVNPSQQNYALGVDYSVMVPRLPVGNHKFHFTARTYEKKPAWLLAMNDYSNKNPYSMMARLPGIGDLVGPNVVTTVPSNNQAPTLSNVGNSPLYRGPKAVYATVTSPTTAIPSDYAVLGSVQGVYHSANFDGHLLADQQKDFYANAGGNPPTSPNPVMLAGTTMTPDTEPLVQHATVNTLRTVTPDVPGAIASVSAVYLMTDPALTTPYAATGLGAGNVITLNSSLPFGTTDVYVKYLPKTATMTVKADDNGQGSGDNAVLTSPAQVGYVIGVYTEADTDFGNNLARTALWKPGDVKVPLWGTVAAGSNLVVRYVPWPPVYLKYFAKEPVSGTPGLHGVFLANEPITFKVMYKDANGDPPTFHDGVQGYVKLVFNDNSLSPVGMTLMGTGNSFVDGIPFGVTLTNVPQGTHSFHFEASDGYVVTRFPADQSGAGANDEKVKVNWKPVLTGGGVDHASGATTFTFSVTYTDKDNVAPTAGGYVQAMLVLRADPTKTVLVPMVASASSGFSSGVKYTGTLDVTLKNLDGTPVVAAGLYDVTFVANDGLQMADSLTGTAVTVRDSNAAPVIVKYEVAKLKSDGTLGDPAGKQSDTFVYRAWYQDTDNDAPVAVFSGVRKSALTLVIDKDQASEQRLAMTMVPLVQPPAPAPPVLPDYTLAAGVEFQARVTGKSLGAGNHTYTVMASDGTLSAATPIPAFKTGPTLMIPYFDLDIASKDGDPISDTAIVGQEVTIAGHLYFPYTTASEIPANISNITLQITKPDSSTASLSASLVDVQVDPNNSQNWVGTIKPVYSGYLDPALSTGDSLTLTASGQWIISGSWPGNALYDPAETDATIDGQNDQIRMSVSGPSRTIAVADPLHPDTSAPVADMITPPMKIGSTSPGAIFGYDRAVPMRIVKWSPTSGQYFWYDVGSIFPQLQSGDAVWIKPVLSDSQTTGGGYPPAEALGVSYTVTVAPTSATIVPIPAGVYASHIKGVYLNSSKTGVNYYIHALATVPFKAGDRQVVLTGSVGNAAQVWVDYVGAQSTVDEGWTCLDNPTVQKAVVGGDPRYMHSQYRLVKVLAQSYTRQTSSTGAAVVDPATKSPLLKPCTIMLNPGWNQIGNIFFNWKKGWQTVNIPSTPGVPPPPFISEIIPVDSTVIGKVIGVYKTPTPGASDTNYYQPGIAGDKTYHRGDASIKLTSDLEGDTTKVYIKYEVYPREDVGIPINEVHVIHLGERKTIAEAKAAGWIADYAWRYDAVQRNYVRVSDTVAGAERVLKAWSGYWVRCYVDCQLEIDPNTSFNGTFAGGAKSMSVMKSAPQDDDMPPPAP